MQWDFHGVSITGQTRSRDIQEKWQEAFASRPEPSQPDQPNIYCELNLCETVPAPPAGQLIFTDDLLAYYRTDSLITCHFPRFGQLKFDLSAGWTKGVITPAGLHNLAVLEDVLAIALAPHLRRHGQFLIHAFSAAKNGKAILLVGERGAGKTTTGMSLLNAGWQLLSNDSPIINREGDILSYPGLLAAYPQTFEWILGDQGSGSGEQRLATSHQLPATIHYPLPTKHYASAESLWPDVWADHAPIGAICFPRINPEVGHKLEPLSPAGTLRRLLTHSIEQWDKAMIPAHLSALRQLVDQAPGYILHLGPDVLAIPHYLESHL